MRWWESDTWGKSQIMQFPQRDTGPVRVLRVVEGEESYLVRLFVRDHVWPPKR